MRNSNLDVAKAFACIGVVIMHCSFPGVFGKFVAYLFKFAVPLFLMISGYFLFKPGMGKINQIKNLKRKARHILIILISAELLSAVYFIGKGWIVDGSYSFSAFTLSNTLVTCLTGTFFNGTLWFLYALLWSYLILLIAIKVLPVRGKINYVLLGVLIFLFHIFLRVAIRDESFYDVRMFRNAVLYGLPFIFIGYGIRKAERTTWYQRLSVTSPLICLVVFVAGYVISVGEYALTRTSIDVYIGTILSSWAMFTFCVSADRKIHNRFLIFVGEKLSLYVYIVHLFVIDAFSGISDQTLYKWCLPLMAVAGSILISYLYYLIKQNVNARHEHADNH